MPAPLEVRPRCGLRAVVQRAVLARLRAHVIARVVGTYMTSGSGKRSRKMCRSAEPSHLRRPPRSVAEYIRRCPTYSPLLTKWRKQLLYNTSSKSVFASPTPQAITYMPAARPLRAICMSGFMATPRRAENSSRASNTT